MASLYAQGRKSAPFKPAGTVFQSKEVDFAGLGPQTEPEPSIVKVVLDCHKFPRSCSWSSDSGTV